tara:strand:+ start:479 stop:760 length:282 start_codon:yes stop_codon:yes gene_type:complete
LAAAIVAIAATMTLFNQRDSMTDDDRVTMIEDQCEHIIALCETYVEGDRLEDVGNIRALYEEYGEWLDTFNGMPQAPEEYTTAWCPNMMECDQ